MPHKIFDSPESRLRLAIWESIALIALADIAGVAVKGFQLEWGHVSFIVIFLIVAIGASFLFRHKWPDKTAASGLEALGQFMAFVSLGGLFSYIAASWPVPYQDEMLINMDRVLGFNWLDYISLVNRHPNASLAFTLAYNSFKMQIIIAIIYLAIRKNFQEMYGLIFAIIFCAVFCIIISAAVPATGAYTYLHIDKNNYPNLELIGGYIHMEELNHLRAGNLKISVFSNPKGLVTFPSFHASLAVLCAWAFFGIKWLRWPMLALNIMMLAATPINGGHYLIDLIAGILLAIIAIIIVKFIKNRESLNNRL